MLELVREVVIARSKVLKNKPKKLKSKGIKLRRRPKKETIVIDRQAGLVFNSEKELLEHFQPAIDQLEKEYLEISKNEKLDEKEFEKLGDLLDLTLDEPAEIWSDGKTFKNMPIFHFIRPLDQYNAYHVAVTYVSSEDEPTFIFLHFVTKDLGIVEKYRRGDLVYDQAFEELGFGAIEGDALSDGDPLAMGLFLAMLKVRSEKDVEYDQFQALGLQLREATIEHADEIWRTNDLNGNALVTFIKEATDHEVKDLYYIAITQEDPSTNVHTLLFSFPTMDINLVDRYRRGENLQAEEVEQESSH